MPDVTVEIRIPSGQAFSSIFKRSLPMYLCQRIAKVYIRVFPFYLSLVGHSGVPICKMVHEKLKKKDREKAKILTTLNVIRLIELLIAKQP